MARKSKKETKAAAVITIRDAADMTPSGRKSIALWMRRQADFLVREGDNLSNRYTARYLYDA